MDLRDIEMILYIERDKNVLVVMELSKRLIYSCESVEGVRLVLGVVYEVEYSMCSCDNLDLCGTRNDATE